ncbi:MAG: hypothetical protein WBE82_05295 [Xanthobacteraceae bacterium]
MAQHTPLYIVASQHPRVGKTLVARLLIEYFRLSGRPIVGYDLDPREPALAAHFLSRVWPVDIADTQGQMALFDRLVADNWRTTVLDIGYGLCEQFFQVMPEIGFEAARHRPDCSVHHRPGADHGPPLWRAAGAAAAHDVRACG